MLKCGQIHLIGVNFLTSQFWLDGVQVDLSLHEIYIHCIIRVSQKDWRQK